jgi:hypothetical protein
MSFYGLLLVRRNERIKSVDATLEMFGGVEMSHVPEEISNRNFERVLPAVDVRQLQWLLVPSWNNCSSPARFFRKGIRVH